MAKPRGFSPGFGSGFGVGHYRYALTPWVWNVSGPTPSWRLPASAVGGIDLRSVLQMAQAGGTPQGFAFAACLQPPGGIEIARALHMSDEPVTALMRDAWQSALGYRPQGDRLVDLLWDQLTTGSDPAGENGPGPLVPGVDGFLRLFVPGHSEVKRERFVWGVHPHTNRLRDRLRRDFERTHEQDQEHARRVLDFWCKKYRVEDWQEFVPTRLRPHVPGRLPHRTTITESFNKADADTLGPDLTWTETNGDWDVVSSACEIQNTGGLTGDARAEHNLSSDDHYVQVSFLNLAAGVTDGHCGAAARFSASAQTYYQVVPYLFGGNFSQTLYLQKFVAGASTTLASPTITVAPGDIVKCEADGSTIKSFCAGVEHSSVTDTAITGNLRTGISGYYGAGGKPRLGSFEAADLAAGGTAFDRNVADSLGAAEAYARLATGDRHLSDLLGAAEVHGRVADGSRSVSESLGVAEAYARLASGNRAFAELLGHADTFTRTATGLRQLLESLGLVDAPASQLVSGERAIIHEMAPTGADHWTLGPA